jgi:hypothetical protein
MRWARHLARTGEDNNACTVLVMEHEGRPRCTWEDNTKVDLKGCGLDWFVWAFRPKGYGRVWTGLVCLGIQTKSSLMKALGCKNSRDVLDPEVLLTSQRLHYFVNSSHA